MALQEHVTWFEYDESAGMNISAQVGDMCYFTQVTENAGFNTADQSSIVQLGRIKEIKLIDTETLDTGGDNGLTYANEARVYWPQGHELYGCGQSNGGDDMCPYAFGIIRIDKSYKEAGIIPGMQIDTNYSTTSAYTDTPYSRQDELGMNGTSSEMGIHRDWITYVKSVNPNGNDENEIEIGTWSISEQSDVFNRGEDARLFQREEDVGTSSPHGVKASQYTAKTDDWVYNESVEESNAYFINQPTKLRFKFDNAPINSIDNSNMNALLEYGYMSQGTENESSYPLLVYPGTETVIPRYTSSGVASPWGGKTKFWMVVTEVQEMADTANIGDFQMFSKDNAVNMSSPIGYYAQVKLENNSKVKSEMFAVAVDVFESSK